LASPACNRSELPTGEAPLARIALIVDDSPTMRQMLSLSLSKITGLEVILAEDGLEAFRHLLREVFDIIITDVDMPVLDGIRLVRLIKADPNHRDVPVVVISGQADAAERQRLLESGAAEYLPKPVQSPQVVATVKRLLGDRPPRRSVRQDSSGLEPEPGI